MRVHAVLRVRVHTIGPVLVEVEAGVEVTCAHFRSVTAAQRDAHRQRMILIGREAVSGRQGVSLADESAGTATFLWERKRRWVVAVVGVQLGRRDVGAPNDAQRHSKQRGRRH